MKKKNSLSLTVVAVVVLCAVVVLITGLIGFVLSSQSSDALRTLINQRMLDISNTAGTRADQGLTFWNPPPLIYCLKNGKITYHHNVYIAVHPF